jgi:hypothetical protein
MLRRCSPVHLRRFPPARSGCPARQTGQLLLLASAEVAALLLRARRPFTTDPARVARATTLVASPSLSALR